MDKIFLFDFDGTLVIDDMLDEVCDIVNKKRESEEINEMYHLGRTTGLQPLIDRINLLQGVSIKQIEDKLSSKDYLRMNTKNLFKLLKEKGFITVLCSGNIMPILEYYKKELNIDYIFGTNPNITQNIITGIAQDDFNNTNFKVDFCKNIIKKHNILKENIYAIGDSISDVKMLDLAQHKFVINPKSGIEKYADKIIIDFEELINIIEKV